MPVSFRTEVSSYSSANIGMYYLLKEYTSAAMLDSEGHQVRQFALPWDYLLRRYTQAGIHFPEEWQPRIAVPECQPNSMTMELLFRLQSRVSQVVGSKLMVTNPLVKIIFTQPSQHML